MLTSAFRAGGSRAILAAWSLAPRCSWAAPASSGRSSRRSPPRGRAAARPSSWPARPASARPGSPPSSPAAPARPAGRPCSAGRSISSAPSCPTSRSPTPCTRSAAHGPPPPPQVPSCRSSRRRSRCSPSRGRRAGAARARGPALGRHVNARPGRLPRPQPGRTTRGAARHLSRRDEPSSKGRMARLADGVRRSGSGLVLDLGPLPPEDLTALLVPAPARRSPRAGRRHRRPLRRQPLLRRRAPRRRPSRTAELPRRLRDLLLQRVERLDAATQDLLRLAAAAGRDVGYPLLRALAAVPEPDVRDVAAPGRRARGPRRRPGRGHLPVPPPAAGRSRLLDDPARRARGAARPAGRGAVAHRGRLAGRARAALGGGGPRRRGADRLGRGGAPGGGRVRPGRGRSRTSSGRSRCGPRCPDAARLDRSRPGRALLLGGRTRQPDRRLAACGRTRPACHRAHRRPGPGPFGPAARAPRGVPVRERQQRRRAGRVRARGRAGPAVVGGAGAGARGVGTGLQMAWRHGESLAVCEQALALARAGRRASGRAAGAHRARRDLAYLGRDEEGLARLGQAVRLAGEIGDHDRPCSGRTSPSPTC